jgi:hypothetical protein
MKRRFLLLLVVIICLLPAQGFAAVCFQSTSTDTERTDNIKLAVGAPVEEFFPLLGEAVRVSCSESAESAPLTGTAHLRSDGKAHFSVFIGGTAGCFPLIIEGTLDPPAFNTGSGNIDIPSNETFGTTTFTAISCPSLPQKQSGGPWTPDR